MGCKRNKISDDERRIETDVAWLMKDVESASLNILGENLIQYGLYAGQPRLMHLVRMNPGSTQNQIAKKLRVSASSISMSIKRLEKQGLVNRLTPDNDQRRNELHLTTEGERISQACKDVVLGLHDHLLAGFEEEEKEILRSYLIRMMDNAEEHPLYPHSKRTHEVKAEMKQEEIIESEIADD